MWGGALFLLPELPLYSCWTVSHSCCIVLYSCCLVLCRVVLVLYSFCVVLARVVNLRFSNAITQSMFVSLFGRLAMLLYFKRTLLQIGFFVSFYEFFRTGFPQTTYNQLFLWSFVMFERFFYLHVSYPQSMHKIIRCVYLSLLKSL